MLTVLRRILVLVLVLAASLAFAQPVAAAPAASSRDEVLQALGVTAKPADYVVIVDTSGTMAEEGRFTRATAAIRSLVGSLNPTDHLSLIGFDTGARVLFRGEVGTNAPAILGTLPAVPTGKDTDIGAGIELGIVELERSGARSSAAIALVTDGKLDTPRDARYADPASPAWRELRARGDALSARHELAAYAIALQSATDAALLKQVFPKAVDVTGDDLGKRLGELNRELLDFQARERLTADLAKSVTVAWSGINWTALAAMGGTTDATLTLTSRYTLIPVEVEGLKATGAGDVIAQVSGLPATVNLAPGKSVDVPVTVTWPPASAKTGALRIAGTIASPWNSVMVNDLGLVFNPQLAHEQPVNSLEAATQPPQAPPFPLLPVIGGLGGLLALVLLALFIRDRRPNLVGSIEIVDPNGAVREFLLAGHTMTLPTATAGEEPLKGSVSPVPPSTKGGRSDSVRLTGRLGKSPVTSILHDRQTEQVGGWQLTYTTERTRSLSMINAATPESVPSVAPDVD